MEEITRLANLPPPAIADEPRVIAVSAPTDDELLALVVDATPERAAVLLVPRRRTCARLAGIINARRQAAHAERIAAGEQVGERLPTASVIVGYLGARDLAGAVVLLPRDAWHLLDSLEGADNLALIVMDGRDMHAGAPDVEHLLARADWPAKLVYVCGAFDATAPIDMCSQCEESFDGRADHGDCIPPPHLCLVGGMALHVDYRAALYAREPRLTCDQIAAAAAGHGLPDWPGQLAWLSQRLADEIGPAPALDAHHRS